MQAIVQDRYGPPDVLALREVTPPELGPEDVLVRVRAASVHPDVWHVLTGRPYVLRLMGSGLRRPKAVVPGTDLAGVVEAVGSGVTTWRPGDEVFGECVRGHQWKNGGAFAELAAVPAGKLARKPERISFEQAAAVPTSGLIAHQAVVDQGHVSAGQRVLVNGAGGGVGAFAVQLAKARGATVTAVDTAPKLAALQSLGADEVLDCEAVDFTRTGTAYDVIVDIPGGHSFDDLRRALVPRGRYVLVGHDGFGRTAGRALGNLPTVFGQQLRSLLVSQDMSPSTKPKTKDPLAVLAAHLETGELTPLVDRVFPLAEVADAVRYLAEGGAVGKVVIRVAD